MSEPKKRPGVNYVPSKGYQPDSAAVEKMIGGIKERMPAKITERKVPVKYRSSLKWEWFREFTFLERIKILFGCNLVVLTGVATQHRPGEFQPLIIGNVSYAKSAPEHMQKVVQNMMEERLPDMGPLNELEPAPEEKK